ncbi:MAG: patatin-like phospholipase family protein [Bacteroidales bacterium]
MKYEIGYALSGGFIKGFAHLGALQALLEHDLRPEIISGVSAGALAGVLYADGNEPYRILEYFENLKFMNFTKFTIPTSGFFKMDEVIDFLEIHLSTKQLEKLKIPFVVTATDIQHGKSVSFRQGNIAQCVAASCCMPMLFKPVTIHEVDYVDGGVFLNLPVSPIRQECKKVIAVNVSPLHEEPYKRNLINITLRTYQYLNKANMIKDRELSDILIEPKDLHKYSNTELEKAKEIFNCGYQAANDILK